MNIKHKTLGSGYRIKSSAQKESNNEKLNITKEVSSKNVAVGGEEVRGREKNEKKNMQDMKSSPNLDIVKEFFTNLPDI